MYNFTNFIQDLKTEIDILETDWNVLGIVDSNENAYSLGTDTKLIGRIFEMLLAPAIKSFAERHNFQFSVPEGQNIYPDFIISYLDEYGSTKYIAIDVKTTYLQRNAAGQYRKSKITLGSYNSFLRNGTKNIVHNYSDYTHHFVVGFFYERNPESNEGEIVNIENVNKLSAPYQNTIFFIQEKHKLSGDKPGSGNTENIGSFSTNNFDYFSNGNGPFSVLGKELFENYWRNYPKYRTTNKAYNNLPSYFDWLTSQSIYSSEEIANFRATYNDWKSLYPSIN